MSDSFTARLLLVLVTVVLTLLATYLIQARVVPKAQAKTRRLERWEDDLNQLDSLLADQLPRALNRFRIAASKERGIREQVEWVQRRPLDGSDAEQRLDPAPGDDAERRAEAEHYAQFIDALRDERFTEYYGVDEQLDRLSILVGRVRRIQPEGAFWGSLEVLARSLQRKASDYLWQAPGEIAPWGEKPFNDDHAWTELLENRERVVRHLEDVVRRMRPPSPWPERREGWNRVVRRAGSALTRRASRPPGSGEAGPPASAPAPMSPPSPRPKVLHPPGSGVVSSRDGSPSTGGE